MEHDMKRRAGEILLNLRLEYGISQRELAETVSDIGPSLSDRHYRRIEKGQMVPSVMLAMTICSVLGSDVYEVWG